MAALRRQQRRPLLPSFSAETTVTDAMRARMEYLFHSETVILRLLDLKAIVKYMGTMITGYITLRERARSAGGGQGGGVKGGSQVSQKLCGQKSQSF